MIYLHFKNLCQVYLQNLELNLWSNLLQLVGQKSVLGTDIFMLISDLKVPRICHFWVEIC